LFGADADIMRAGASRAQNSGSHVDFLVVREHHEKGDQGMLLHYTIV